jgi:hypothetical protein
VVLGAGLGSVEGCGAALGDSDEFSETSTGCAVVTDDGDALGTVVGTFFGVVGLGLAVGATVPLLHVSNSPSLKSSSKCPSSSIASELSQLLADAPASIFSQSN